MFKKFDYLGNPFTFIYEDDVRFKTNCGGLLSICIFLISLITFIFMMLEFLDRSNPNVSITSNKLIDPPLIKLKRFLNFSVRISDGNSNIFLDSKKFKFEVLLITMHNEDYYARKETPLQVEQCDSNHYPKNYQYFINMNLSESLCPIFSDSDSIEGNFISENFSFVEIRVSLCTDQSYCDPIEEIKNYLDNNDVRVHIFYSDTDFDEKNFENPIISYINNYNLDLTYQDEKSVEFFFQNSTLTSIETYVFFLPSEKIFSEISFDHYSVSSKTRINSSTVMSFIIKSSQIIIKDVRSYVNLSTTLANISGILNVSMILLNVVNYCYSRQVFFSKLINKSLFYYSSVQNIETNLNVNTSMIPFNNIKKNDNIENDYILRDTNAVNFRKKISLDPNKQKLELSESKNKTEEIMKTQDFQKQKFKVVKFKFNRSFFYLFFISFCSCFYKCSGNYKNQMKIREYSLKHIFHYLDYFKFVNLFIEMEIIKKCLIEKEEMDIFKILHRLIFVKNEEIGVIISKSGTNTFQEKINSLYKKSSIDLIEEKLKNYLIKLNTKTEKTIVEKNLLERFDSIVGNKI